MSDPDLDDLERRLAAVERALTDGDATVADVDDRAAATGRTTALGERVDATEARLDDLDAGLQAVRGFLGGVRAVNEAVERRANLALARADRLERRLDGDPVDDVPLRGPDAEGEEDPVDDDTDDPDDRPTLSTRLRNLA